MKLGDFIAATAASLAALGIVVWAGAWKAGKMVAESDDAIRQRIVDIARAQLGKAELNRYFSAVAPEYVGSKPEWCGIFALWVLNQAGLAPGVKWVVAKGFLFRLPQTTSPKPGDIAYYTSNQHQAIVVGVRGDTVDLINGNGMGGVVTASSPPLSKAAAYFSIQPWIDAAKQSEAVS